MTTEEGKYKSKVVKLVLGSLILLAILVFVFISFVFRSPITSDEFKDILSDDFEFTDKTDDLSEETIDNMTYANNGTFTIRYFDYASRDRAKEMFDNAKEKVILNALGFDHKEVDDSLGLNFMSYTKIGKGFFVHSCLISDTEIFIICKEEYKDQAIKYLKKLGYY